MDVKNGRDIRVYAALWDVPVHQLAQEVGTPVPYLSAIMHERAPLSRGMRARLEQAFTKIGTGEVEPGPFRRKTRAEPLREEQLASGCNVTVRSL